MLRRTPVPRHDVRAAEARLQLVGLGYQLHFATRRRQPHITGHRQRPGGEGAGRRRFGHAQASHHADTLATVLLGDAVQAVPHALRQARGGEEKQLDAGEEHLTQLGVLFQCLGQFFPALGHGQVGRWRDFAQVAQGFAEALRGGFAGIQIEAATVVQHDAKVVAAAKGVVPRQPVHQHRRLFSEHREGLQQHLLVGAEHALGSDHRLGQFGGARREEELGDGVGPGGGKRCIASSGIAGLQQAVEAKVPTPRRFAAHADHGYRRIKHGIEGAQKRLSIGGEHQPGGQHLAHMPQLGKVLRQQRIGRRYRAIRDASIHGTQRNLQMLDVIAGKQRQRPLGAQAKSQQVGCDGAHLAEHLRIGDLAPGAVRLTRGNKNCIGAHLCPVQQPVEQTRRQRRQGLDRLHAQDAVGFTDLHLRVPDGHLPVGRALARVGRP
ncbi:hypothetical protein D3C79_682040 [compost metagenome]